MNSVRHFCWIASAVFALGLCPASLAHAQSNKADELNQRVDELYRAGRFAEAIPLAQQLLAIKEKDLGPDHPEVATALTNLADLYGQEGRYAEAELLYKRALTIYEALGPNPPNVQWWDLSTAFSNLDGLYKRQGRTAEAEALEKRWQAMMAPPQSNTEKLYQRFDDLYKAGRFAEAIPLAQEVLAIAEKERGPDHPEVAIALRNLAFLYKEQGRSAEAEPLLKRALTIYENALGRDHPDFTLSLNVVTAFDDLALLYKQQGRYAEAEPVYKRALTLYDRYFAPMISLSRRTCIIWLRYIKSRAATQRPNRS